MASISDIAKAYYASIANSVDFDSEDLSASELKTKASNYVKDAQEESDTSNEINSNDVVDELYDLLLEDKITTDEETETEETQDTETTDYDTQIAKIEAQIAKNNKQLEILSNNIKWLQEDIENTIDEKLDKLEELEEEQKKEAKKIVEEQLEEYKASNKSDNPMSYEEFQANLAAALGGLNTNSEFSKLLNDLNDAESNMYALNSYASKMESLTSENEELEAELSSLNDIKEAAAEAEAETTSDSSSSSSSEGSCCDPIGFEKDGTRYDFFVDSDGNGDITNENEFLGAEDGWSSMKELDTDGDGKVTSDEMEGLKLVVTNADGSQEIKDATEVFDEDDSINLSSYTSLNEDIGSGNTLLGTYDITFDEGTSSETSVEGYNTLDDVDWLEDNYDFTDENSSDVATSGTTVDIEAIKATNAELENELAQVWSMIGIERDYVVSEIQNHIKNTGLEKGEQIKADFEIQKAKEELEQEEEQEEAEAKEAEEAKVAEAEAEEAEVEEKEEEIEEI